MIKKIIILLILLIFIVSMIWSQELNMKITVNSDRISGTDRNAFTTLEEALNQFVNGRKWTDDTFASNEKIECSMLITISEIPEDNSYKSDIQVTSNRPVFNSTYMTPLFNFKDGEFEFNYLTGQNIEFSESNIDNNLTATIAFYVYIILGLDYDSFALNGGKPFFDKAMNIATGAQSLISNKGWAPFGGDRNRYALALSFTNGNASIFHTMWYNYHRKGLDEMAANATRGRMEIENTLPSLQQIYQARPASPILFFYGDTKLNELVSIYSKSTSEDKANAAKILENIFPTKRYIIESLKK